MTTSPPDVAPRPPGGTTHGAVLHVAVPEDPAARLGFSGRTGEDGAGNVSLVVPGGDDEAVLAARTRLAAAVGVGPDDVVYGRQVHGADVAVVTADDAGRGARSHADAVGDVDALVTVTADVAVAVFAADCVPVLLVDPGRGVGAAHAGRPGVVEGVVPAAVAALVAATGGRVAGVVAVVGPAIGGCCYEVPAAMAHEVVERLDPDIAAHVAGSTTWGAPSLDLPAAVVAQLELAGVARVERVGACTRCHSDRWFSHRAAGESDRTPPAAPGRQAGIVVRLSGGPPQPHPSPPPASAATRSIDS